LRVSGATSNGKQGLAPLELKGKGSLVMDDGLGRPMNREMNRPVKPTADQLLAARCKTVLDVIAPGLDVLFCGINPGLYSGATGHHFARPGNRFWPALYRSGFTDRLLHPAEERELLKFGCGITNLVARTTANAAELTTVELIRGRRRLLAKVERYGPRCVAVLGITAYRIAFDEPNAGLGRQPGSSAGIPVWVLPNPSGLNAHHQLDDLARRFGELRAAISPAARPRQNLARGGLL
jgi:TDG/mug DNA glycosylase family protein